MSLSLVPRSDNPWSQGRWQLAADYPEALAQLVPENRLAAEQLYALAKSKGITTADDPRLGDKPFPQRNSIYNAMAASALQKRLKAAEQGFLKVYLEKL